MVITAIERGLGFLASELGTRSDAVEVDPMHLRGLARQVTEAGGRLELCVVLEDIEIVLCVHPEPVARRAPAG